MRRRRLRKAQRAYDGALPLAEQWNHAMSFIGQPGSGLFYITRVRQNARRGQKIYLQLARRSADGCAMGYEEAGWIEGAQFTPGTWVAGSVSPPSGTQGTHHNEQVRFIHAFGSWPDSTRAAWQHVQQPRPVSV